MTGPGRSQVLGRRERHQIIRDGVTVDAQFQPHQQAARARLGQMGSAIERQRGELRRSRTRHALDALGQQSRSLVVVTVQRTSPSIATNRSLVTITSTVPRALSSTPLTRSGPKKRRAA